MSEELKEFLKNNLSVNLHISEEFGNKRTIRINVDLVLEEEVISTSYDYFSVED